MNITEQDIVDHRKSGSWRRLEQLAKSIVADAEERAGSKLHPMLGGGTRVMLALNHRISNDIDLFIRDPQWLGYLSPGLGSKFASVVPNYQEGPTSLKLKLPEGEIDFIVARSVLNLPEETSSETSFALEPIAEVLAKKLFYRGWRQTSRISARRCDGQSIACRSIKLWRGGTNGQGPKPAFNCRAGYRLLAARRFQYLMNAFVLLGHFS